MTIAISENDLEEKDLANVNQLLFQLNPELLPVSWARVADLMQKGFLFSARDSDLTSSNPKGDLVGMISLIPVVKLAASLGNIEDFVVLENYRGRGIGKRLMTEAMKKAKNLKLEQLFLTSNKRREVARAIYKKSGFEEYDTTPFKLVINNR